MYDELVQKLRSVKGTWQSEEEQWMLEAADAIEAMCGMVASAYQENANIISSYEEDKLHWISVKERLPEPGERVLYCYRGFVGEGYVSRSGDWERAGIWTFYCPSHWMPLPKPPKEVDDGN